MELVAVEFVQFRTGGARFFLATEAPFSLDAVFMQTSIDYFVG